MTDKKTVLCVDDDPDIVASLRSLIEGNGYGFVNAVDGQEGVRVYNESHPDLIIVDLMMEEVDAGMTMVKELIKLGNQAPVYMLSSVGNMLSQSVDCATLGLSGVFQKPIQPEVLLSTLKLRLT